MIDPTAEPKVNMEFFGKKVANPPMKVEAVTSDQLAKPKAYLTKLVYWRWDTNTEGGYRIGKLRGASSLVRRYFVEADILAMEKKSDGRHFQTGYYRTPAEQWKECVTVADVIRVFCPDEVVTADAVVSA